MHFKGYVITKELPTEERLEEILKPYHYENDKTGVASWDWYQIGGRFGGQIKIKFDPNENEYNWYCLRDRNNKYFISQAINELKENIKPYYDELDWLQYMGLNEKILYVDGGYYKDMIDFNILDCCLVIDEKNVYSRQDENWEENKNFESEVKQIDLTDKFITVIDFHI